MNFRFRSRCGLFLGRSNFALIYELFGHEQMTSRTKLKRKQVDDVLGGDEMWKHAPSTGGDLSSNRCRVAILMIDNKPRVINVTMIEHTICSYKSDQQMSL